MSCLTREMQKKLTKYIKRNIKAPSQRAAAEVHASMVEKGVCPSDVTVDQVAVMIEGLQEA